MDVEASTIGPLYTREVVESSKGGGFSLLGEHVPHFFISSCPLYVLEILTLVLELFILEIRSRRCHLDGLHVEQL